MIWGNAIFQLFYVSLADVDILYKDSLSRELAFNCLMFMLEISNRNKFWFCCSYYHWSYNSSHNKFEFNPCDWLLRDAAAWQTKQKWWMAISVPCAKTSRVIIVFGTSSLSLQNKQQERQKVWKNCHKNTTFHLVTWNLHRENFAGTEKKENNDQRSKWKFVDMDPLY